MSRQGRILVVCRRISLGVALLGGLYLVSRFDLVTLPTDICCPLSRFEPGDRLIVDRKAPALHAGDAVLVKTQSGRLHLTKIESIRESDGRLWCVTDRKDCPGLSSAAAGWIDPRAAEGRVLIAWDF